MRTCSKYILKEIKVKRKYYDPIRGDIMERTNMIKDDSMNSIKGLYFSIVGHFKADNGWMQAVVRSRPILCNDLQTEGLLFEQNTKKSGLQKCPLLNIRLSIVLTVIWHDSL